MDCPSSAIWVESCSQIFLQRLRSVYKELPLADLPKNLINLAEDDLSKPLKKMIVGDKRVLYYRRKYMEIYHKNFKIVETNLKKQFMSYL